MRVRLGAVAPDIIHQLLTGKNTAGEGHHLIEQHEFLLGQRHRLVSGMHRQGIAFQHRTADDLPTLIGHLRPTQQRPHPQHHFIDIDGLYHIVVAAGQEAQPHVVKRVLCGDHHDRDRHASLPQCPYQLIAVHFRHHDIRDDHVVVAGVHGPQGFFAVGHAHHRIAVFGQHMLKQLPQFMVILRDQYLKHGVPPVYVL